MSFTSRNTTPTAFPMLDLMFQMQQIGLQALTMFRPPMGFGTYGAAESRDQTTSRPFQPVSRGPLQRAAAEHDTHEEHIVPVGEEVLNVGTRMVPGKTTRVRRVVVQTPVEQEVTLHTETVVVERRKPIGMHGDDILTEVTVEMSDFNEVPVVSKGVRLVEEVLLRKEVTARTETIRDTLKRDRLEIDQPSQLPALFGARPAREELKRDERKQDEAKPSGEHGVDVGQGTPVIAAQAGLGAEPRSEQSANPESPDRQASQTDRKPVQQPGQKR